MNYHLQADWERIKEGKYALNNKNKIPFFLLKSILKNSFFQTEKMPPPVAGGAFAGQILSGILPSLSGNIAKQASPNIVNVPVNTGNNSGNKLINGEVEGDMNGGDSISYSDVTVSVNEEFKIWAARNEAKSAMIAMGVVIAVLFFAGIIGAVGWYRTVRANRPAVNRRNSRRRSSRVDSIVSNRIEEEKEPEGGPPAYADVQIPPPRAPLTVLPLSKPAWNKPSSSSSSSPSYKYCHVNESAEGYC